MTSGIIYSVLTMPLETTKNRMAVQKPDPVTGTYILPQPCCNPLQQPASTHHVMPRLNCLANSLHPHPLPRTSYLALCLAGILPYRSTTQAMIAIVKESGVQRGLYAGFLPYYIRCGGMTLLMFMSVEWLRKTAKQYA